MRVDKLEVLNQYCLLYGQKIVLREDTHTHNDQARADIKKGLNPPNHLKKAKNLLELQFHKS